MQPDVHMPQMTLGWAAAALGVAVDADVADRPITGVTQDTRQLQPGALYVALTGDRFDGHDFVAKAGALGAAAVLVAKPQPIDLPQLVVADTLKALQTLATAWRGEYGGVVFGVTGSNGKTTTRQILQAICAAAAGDDAVLATAGNLNNHIGLPLTVLKLTASHRFAVLEMGASKQGDIAELAAIGQPQIGIVTQAAAAHTEGFGSLAGVARGKGEMFAALLPSGTAVINADDCFAPLWQDLSAHCGALTFGTRADVRLADSPGHQAGAQGVGARTLALETPQGAITAEFELPGAHNVMNALAAVAAALAAGVSKDAIARGLAAVQPPPGRLTRRVGRDGLQILDDTYNANPTSAAAAIHVLAECAGARIMVLGEMRELGDDADSGHRSVGLLALERGVDHLFCIGEATRPAAEAFGQQAQYFDDQAAARPALAALLAGREPASTTVLLKGSRGARLEQTVDWLTDAPAATSNDPVAGQEEAA